MAAVGYTVFSIHRKMKEKKINSINLYANAFPKYQPYFTLTYKSSEQKKEKRKKQSTTLFILRM